VFLKKYFITCDLNKHFFTFLNRNFLKTQFSNGSFSVIWSKFTLFLHKITISNAPLYEAFNFLPFNFYVQLVISNVLRLRLLSITHLKMPLKRFMLNKNVSRRVLGLVLLAGCG
jgi:hypothetical protein